MRTPVQYPTQATDSGALLLVDQQAELDCRKQILRAELCGLAVLIGEGLAVVYVIGSLLLNCLKT
ncbi:MAG: hypothetical protein AMXMBFR13_17360 [Phycisphaerae bacterium]|jgi:hypothetical protein